MKILCRNILQLNVFKKQKKYVLIIAKLIHLVQWTLDRFMKDFWESRLCEVINENVFTDVK